MNLRFLKIDAASQPEEKSLPGQAAIICTTKHRKRIPPATEDDFREDVLKVCVVFDCGASARDAKEFLRRVCQTGVFDLTLLRLGEHLSSPGRDDSARMVSDVHLLVVAMQTEHDLPVFAKAWLGRWVNSRTQDLDGALVALVTNGVVAPDSDSQFIAHLETVAVAARLAFFYGGVRDHGETCQAEASPRPLPAVERLPSP